MEAASKAVELTLYRDNVETFHGVAVYQTGSGYCVKATSRIPRGTVIYKGTPLITYNNVVVEGIGLVGGVYCMDPGDLLYLLDSISHLYPRSDSDMAQYLKFKGVDNNLSFTNPAYIVYSKTDHNVFSTGGKSMAVYKHGSAFNHSCNPNCFNATSEVSSKMVVVTIDDIEVGQECTLTYDTGILDIHSASKRIEILEQKMFFTCRCEHCRDDAPVMGLYRYYSNMTGWTGRCATCLIPGCTQKCSSCKSVTYCSRKCQVDNWREHRSVCKKK